MSRRLLINLVLGQSALTLLGLLLVWVTQRQVSLWGTSGILALLWGVLGALVSYALVWWLARSPGVFGDHLRRAVEKIVPLFQGMSWFWLVVLSLLAGVGEEILFRAFLQQWLVDHMGALAGISLATLVFAGLHYLSLPYCLVVFALGLLLALAYHFTQSLMLVMVWHSLYDLIALGFLARLPETLTSRSKPVGSFLQ